MRVCKELCGCLKFGERLNVRGLLIRLSSRPTFGPLSGHIWWTECSWDRILSRNFCYLLAVVILTSLSSTSSPTSSVLAAFRRLYGFSSGLLTRWRSWLRRCATNRKVAGSIPSGVTGIFHWHNPSRRTLALGLTQSQTEMSKTR